VGRLPTQKTVSTLVSDLSNPRIRYATSADGVFKTQNAGESWKTMNTGLSQASIAALALHPIQSLRLYAVATDGTIFRSTDGAATWQHQGQLPVE
jgi:photosystem II stability/assembly factor-like uncharacterized protein